MPECPEISSGFVSDEIFVDHRLSAGPLNIRKMLNFPGAIAEFFRLHAHPIQQRKPKVGLRRINIRIDYVAARLYAAIPAAQEQTRYVVMQVLVRVAHAAAVNRHRMIEQGSVAFLNRFELLDQVGKLFHVMAFDFRGLLNQLGSAPVMRQRVMRIGEAELGVGSGTGFLGVN